MSDEVSVGRRFVLGLVPVAMAVLTGCYYCAHEPTSWARANPGNHELLCKWLVRESEGCTEDDPECVWVHCGDCDAEPRLVREDLLGTAAVECEEGAWFWYESACDAQPGTVSIKCSPSCR